METGKFYLFDDSGKEWKPEDHPKPTLCTVCKYDKVSSQAILCNLNRMDHYLGLNKSFQCAAFAAESFASEPGDNL